MDDADEQGDEINDEAVKGADHGYPETAANNGETDVPHHLNGPKHLIESKKRPDSVRNVAFSRNFPNSGKPCQSLFSQGFWVIFVENDDAMSDIEKIQLFESKKVRTAWDEEKQEWFFSIVDVCGILTDQPTHERARNYWKVLKNRLKKEGSEVVTNCNRLKVLVRARSRDRVFPQPPRMRVTEHRRMRMRLLMGIKY